MNEFQTNSSVFVEKILFLLPGFHLADWLPEGQGHVTEFGTCNIWPEIENSELSE